MDSAAPDETQGPRERERERERARPRRKEGREFHRVIPRDGFEPRPRNSEEVGSGFWGRVEGDAFLVDSGKDSFRFYEGIAPLSRWEKLSLFLARVCFTM